MEGGGGALFAQGGGKVVLSRCAVYGNAAGPDGAGGAVASDGCFLTAVNCLFCGNQAKTGGALVSITPGPVLNLGQCALVSNRASSGTALSWPGGWRTLSNSIVWNGAGWTAASITARYCNIQGGWSGTGNINADPLFVDPGHWDDNGTPGEPSDDFWVHGVYRLQPGSPCIDAASNDLVPADTLDLDGDGNTTEPVPFDIAGNPRFFDDPNTPDTGYGTPPIVDMGAYEFLGPGVLVGDVNCDGYVDSADIPAFVLALANPTLYTQQYPDCPLANRDINRDGHCDFGDINPFVVLLTGP